MFTSTDTLTKYYQCLMGHFAMLIIIIFDQTDHLEAGVVGGVPVTEESKIGFTVCLVLTMIGIVIEAASLAVELPGIPRSLYCTVSHTTATFLILLFIFDSHPPSHFWVLLATLSVIPCLLALIVIVQKLSNTQKQE